MTIMTPIEGITAPLPPLATLAPHGDTPNPTAADPIHPVCTINPPPRPVDTFTPVDEAPLVPSRRQDGWSAANQRLFLEAIAEGFGVKAATMRVGLSAASAYAFRRTAKGAAFALGWRAATLVARDCVADTLMVRALEGQVETLERADGTIVTRHRHDNRLAMSLLARLDRQVEAAADADVRAARLVAQEFDAFLDLVTRDEGPARAGLFLARRCGGLATSGGAEAAPGTPDATHDLAPIYALAAADRLVRTGVATAQEVNVSDLDPAARADWTADQWRRADAAGILAVAAPAPTAEEAGLDEENLPASQLSQHSARRAEQQGWSASCGEPGRPVAPRTGSTAWLRHDELADTRHPTHEPVWWCEEDEEWRTCFPPAPGHYPDYENHEPSHPDYARSLSEEEAALMDDPRGDEAELAAMAAERDAYFAALAGRTGGSADADVAEEPAKSGGDASDTA